MPITTYTNEVERMSWLAVADKDLNEILQEVNSKLSDGKYLIRTSFRITGKLWWKKLETYYTLFYHPTDYIETQIINFAGCSTSPDKYTIENYFTGLLNGLDAKRSKHENP